MRWCVTTTDDNGLPTGHGCATHIRAGRRGGHSSRSPGESGPPGDPAGGSPSSSAPWPSPNAATSEKAATTGSRHCSHTSSRSAMRPAPPPAAACPRPNATATIPSPTTRAVAPANATPGPSPAPPSRQTVQGLAPGTNRTRCFRLGYPLRLDLLHRPRKPGRLDRLVPVQVPPQATDGSVPRGVLQETRRLGVDPLQPGFPVQVGRA